MPANKYALLRYRIIDRCLNNPGKPFPSREDLRNACEEALFGSGGENISLSTIDKDLWSMKNEGELGYYAPIVYNRENKGYSYSEEGYSISELSIGDDDLEAIRFAAAILDQFRHVPILRQYENAIEKIINRVNISPNPDDQQLEKYIQFEKSTVSQGNEFLGPLLSAIRERKGIRLSYQKFGDPTARDYLLHPYLLKEYHNRWYLLGYDPSRKVMRTFGLERMVTLEKTRESFRLQAGFDPALYFQHTIGITEKAGKPEKVVLDFDPSAAPFLVTQPIHPSQEISNQENGFVRLTIHVFITPELLQFILGYGPQVRVISPVGLRNQVAKFLREASDLYS